MVVRFMLIFLTLVLLLNPLLKQQVNQVEEPSFVIAVDNSSSMIQGLDSVGRANIFSAVQVLKDKLQSKNYEVYIHTLDAQVGSTEEIKFDQKTTNLDRWLKEIQSIYEGRNLGGVYLISDGKYNQGNSPAYFPYDLNVFSLGIGDTVQKKDVVLQQVLHNKIAYQGNKFPLVAEIVNHGYKGEKTRIEVRNNGKVLAASDINFTNQQGLISVELEVEAERPGMQQLDIRVSGLKDELTKSNNSRRVFVDVVDGKQKILLIAPSPHPDIKALAAVIESNQNYELTTVIPGLSEFKNEKYDLVIAHQAYSRYRKVNDLVEVQRKNGVPVLLIFGQRSNTLIASRTEELFKFSQVGAKRDLVFGALNDDFTLFSLPQDMSVNSSNYPPVSVPYGEAKLPAGAQILLYQRVGSILTDRPLLYLNEQNGQKSAFMLAEGFWKWRMQEFALTDGTEVFDNLWLKTIQYLSTKVDKRKFKFYPSTNTYFENQTVKFHAEIYNQIYERIYGESVTVSVYNSEGFSKEYNFTPSSVYSKLEASNFPPGLYDYRANVMLNGKEEVVYGKFSVKELQLEALDQVADFGLLRQIASNTDGRFYTGVKDLLNDIEDFQFSGVIHTQEDIFPIIHLKWVLAALLLFASVEWFTRKYNGGY